MKRSQLVKSAAILSMISRLKPIKAVREIVCERYCTLDGLYDKQAVLKHFIIVSPSRPPDAQDRQFSSIVMGALPVLQRI